MSKIKTGNPQEATEYGTILAQWAFPEMPHYKRSRAWYAAMSMIVVVLSIYALATNNFLFFFIILLFVLILFLSHRSSKTIIFQIAQDGVVIGKMFYPYEQLEDFWIAYRPPQIKMLYFTTKKFFVSHISIPLENQNPVHIRKALLKYLDENPEKDDMPFSDHFSRWLKL